MKRKRLVILLSILVGLLALAGCAPAAEPNGPTPTATDLPRGTPDQRMATPAYGLAERPRSQGPLPLQLHSLPDRTSAIAGQIYPGDEGMILGLDATETWVLVQFGDTIGWTPVNTLALLIAN